MMVVRVGNKQQGHNSFCPYNLFITSKFKIIIKLLMIHCVYNLLINDF